MSKGRVLYLMHVDWRWIKQRPHFLAEGLAQEGWDVVVGFAPTWRRGALPPNRSTLHRYPLPTVPRWATAWGELWNDGPARVAIRQLVRRVKPDVIWITHAGLGGALTGVDVPIVYDAMDLNAEFLRKPAQRRRASQQEQRAYRGATQLFYSSPLIGQQMEQAGASKRAQLRYVPNAYDATKDWKRARRADGVYRLTYVGTISSWLDVALLREAVRQHDNVAVRLVGPGRIATSLGSEAIECPGAISHDELADVAADTDCFLLPFHVTPLVRGVDPVKLYEYLAMERPVIARYYSALERFRGLVEFYHCRRQFHELVSRQPTAAAAERVTTFLGENTWAQRARAVSADLERHRR